MRLKMLKEKNLQCVLHSAKDIMLHCDANKMQRVFDNLLRNAAIYSYSDTEITITTELRANKVTIVFENCGANIPEEKLEQIL